MHGVLSTRSGTDVEFHVAVLNELLLIVHARSTHQFFTDARVGSVGANDQISIHLDCLSCDPCNFVGVKYLRIRVHPYLSWKMTSPLSKLAVCSS